MDFVEVEDRVHHQPDDGSLGFVNYGPWLSADHGTVFDPTSDVEVGGEPMPTAFALGPVGPNPSHGSVRIYYALPEPSWVRIEVFDALGRKVATLVDELQKPGFKVRRWEAPETTSGVLFYRFRAGNFEAEGKLILLN